MFKVNVNKRNHVWERVILPVDNQFKIYRCVNCGAPSINETCLKWQTCNDYETWCKTKSN